MFDKPVVRRVGDIEEEGVVVENKQRARYRMLFSADRTETHSLTCGVATLDPENPLPLHRHEHAEIYFGLTGDACVRVEGENFPLSAGTAIFIPGNLSHAVHTTTEARLLFLFSADSYSDVRYIYLDSE
ncbi:MAG: dimethylsulfonioproprionate lyase family protein [Martelella sp.]|uniref:cupin domain-containing protein n=1 Tax=Martelella sp. TaxID=1969699 RepID=UPI003242D2C3